MKSSSQSKLPIHVAFIMDGNGRWAQKRLLPRKMGHREGVIVMKRLCGYLMDLGVDYVTFYAFSSENKDRPKDEVDSLIDLIRKQMKPMAKDLFERGASVRFLGDLSYFPDDVIAMLHEIEKEGIENKGGVVSIALNYGGRSEMLRAVNLAVRKGRVVDEKELSSLLYTSGMPDPDLIVRTGGEKRLSNFLLFQSAYSEFYFSDKLWPDIKDADIDEILADFARRTRRFGKI